MDPFAGIFTVPYVAEKLGRIGWGIELAKDYWQCGVGYCEQAERERLMPTLFDLADAGIPGAITTGPEPQHLTLAQVAANSDAEDNDE